ncbi:hypothetical protein AB0I98_16860 [Streptomyces sp. NPDC050211]|uniref:hypothetical protein n=1 Tax=Streptomyces sp. NPDC050211 TaxID=3154932 RepID=UPI00344485F0
MNYVTFGGVTVGLCILIYQVVTWYPGFKTLRSDPARQLGKLLPFLLGWSYGCLTTLGVGGLIGTASSATLGLSNWLGDVALVWGVGESSGQLSARPTFVPLTTPGAAVVLILTVAFIAAVKKSRYSSELKRGAWCGITLGTSAGIAGFAAVPLAEAANWLGDQVYGAIR